MWVDVCRREPKKTEVDKWAIPDVLSLQMQSETRMWELACLPKAPGQLNGYPNHRIWLSDNIHNNYK